MKRLLLMLFLMAGVLVSCEEDDNDDDNNNQDNNTTEDPTSFEPPGLSDLDAVMIALNTSTTIEVPLVGTTTQITGMALARFVGVTDAGTVSCEGQELQNNQGAYFFTIGPANPMGIDFDNSVEWDVSGSGSVNAFNYSYMKSVPEIGPITGVTNDEVDRSQDLTVGLDVNSSETDISSADSLAFVVIDSDGTLLMKTQGKSQNTATFTASELGGLATGQGFVQVVGYTYMVRQEGSLDVAYLNEGVAVKTVDIK